MNIVLDIGNVLIDFKPMHYLCNLFSDQSLACKMNDTIFLSPEWVKLDEGLLTHDEACHIFCLREPTYESAIIHTMLNLTDMLTPIHSIIELLPKIIESGYNLYYLSNYHMELRDYVVNKYQFFELFDGGVFSCDVHLVKPSPEIFNMFLSKYSLLAEKCLFFDDVEENVTAARNAGINGVLFSNANSMTPYIHSL